ncbi:MAG: DUF4215 domain-containing protein [Myxococcales bacterium]|nr:DUF4215 domain-containing protein [Myxococcales bacterium]
MKMQRISILGMIIGLGSAAALAAACSGTDTVNGGNGICGNGLVEGTEQCDDGNANDADGCSNTCAGAASTVSSTGSTGIIPGTCGNGTLDPGEVCDDGDKDDSNACGNDCQSNIVDCGNGKVDKVEECDDGNNVSDDGCTNLCTLPACGDGIVQMGEDCDDGNSEFMDKCPGDCKNPGGAGGSGGSGGDPCGSEKSYAGTISNNLSPMMTGMGFAVPWSFNSKLGFQGGQEMCKAIGADHVCTYAEIVAADGKGELANLDLNLTYWLHRTTPVTDGGVTFLPGAGARCNEWTYPTDHISDGEWFQVYQAASSFNAGGHHIGSLSYHLDGNPDYDGMAGKVCKTNTQNCAGGCAGGGKRAILCCNSICK